MTATYNGARPAISHFANAFRLPSYAVGASGSASCANRTVPKRVVATPGCAAALGALSTAVVRLRVYTRPLGSRVAVRLADDDAGRELLVLLPVAVLLHGLLQKVDAFRLEGHTRARCWMAG